MIKLDEKVYIDDDGFLVIRGLKGIKSDEKDFSILTDNLDIQAKGSIYIGSDKNTVIQSKTIHLNPLGAKISGFLNGLKFWKK